MAISAVNIVQTSVLLFVIIIFLRFKRSGKKVLSMQSMLHEANPPSAGYPADALLVLPPGATDTRECGKWLKGCNCI